MSITTDTTRHARSYELPGEAGGLDIYVEQVGHGPDVLLIGGLGDTVESWQFQLDGLADRFRLTAFDNRGAGRTPLPNRPLSVATMADDAAALLRDLDVPSAHVAGFSMGSAIAQELALRRLAEKAPSERAFFEAFFTWIYPPRAHADGTVDQIVEEALAFPHQQSVEGFQAQLDACLAHHTADRLSQIAAPTLVLAGELDTILPPRFGHAVAQAIPNARFEVMPGEAHQPFQEVPDQFNARVDAFWRDIDRRA